MPCRGKRSEREWDGKEREGLQMEQALLSPSCPPSSMPFQLKSAVVIKFQQGLGATVRRTDGGLPWHKDDTIQEDRGGQAEKEGGWQMLFIHVHCQIRTPPSSWHLKKIENEMDIQTQLNPAMTFSPNQGYSEQIRLLYLRHVRNIL